jgi:acetyl-CoA acetyltransferase
MAGAPRIGGQTVMQACATGARALLAGVQEVEAGLATMSLVITCDRTSNGPHLYYPNPQGPGGTGAHEDWVLENFRCDPLGSHAMVRTAENVAARHRVSMAEQHDVVLRREAQYGAAKADNSAFLRRFITLPFDVPAHDFRKTIKRLDGDEGIHASTPAALARLRPVIDGGTVTYGAQTHPADGNAGIVVTTRERAREVRHAMRRVERHLESTDAFDHQHPRLIEDPTDRPSELHHGSEVAPPDRSLPAARHALAAAGLAVRDLHAIKTHNPFAVNDVLFAREMDVDLDAVNNFGSSLVWGHPQAPMGTRSIIELIEELALRGGGDGLFTGCAAGDTAMAVVLRVGDA